MASLVFFITEYKKILKSALVVATVTLGVYALQNLEMCRLE